MEPQKAYQNTEQSIRDGIIDFLDSAGFTFSAYEIQQKFITAQLALRLALKQEDTFPSESWVKAAQAWLLCAEYWEI